MDSLLEALGGRLGRLLGSLGSLSGRPVFQMADNELFRVLGGLEIFFRVCVRSVNVWVLLLAPYPLSGSHLEGMGIHVFCCSSFGLHFGCFRGSIWGQKIYTNLCFLGAVFGYFWGRFRIIFSQSLNPKCLFSIAKIQHTVAIGLLRWI